jgi:hypothetical protein
MILPYIDIPAKLPGTDDVPGLLDEKLNKLNGDSFLYGSGIIDHPVLDFRFAGKTGNGNEKKEYLYSGSLFEGFFENKDMLFGDKFEKERFARELLAGSR